MSPEELIPSRTSRPQNMPLTCGNVSRRSPAVPFRTSASRGSRHSCGTHLLRTWLDHDAVACLHKQRPYLVVHACLDRRTHLQRDGQAISNLRLLVTDVNAAVDLDRELSFVGVDHSVLALEDLVLHRAILGRRPVGLDT